MEINIIKVILPSIFSFIVGISITPILTNFLYKHKLWKKKTKNISLDGGGLPIFNKLHAEGEVSVPRMGGIIIWVSILVTTIFFWILARTWGGIFLKLDFLSRDQTWIILFILIFGAVVGLIDDILEVRGVKDNKAGGLSLKKRLFLVSAISFLISLWFYFKLGVNAISIPFYGVVNFGLFFIPIFILVALFIYSGGIIDGLDGLAGGVFSSIFLAYAAIAFFQNQINVSAFCAAIAGSILAFLWFNIPPARFYMSETGSMALSLSLVAVAFITDNLGGGIGVSVLPVIAFPLVITSVSVIIQFLSKKLRDGKKIFIIAPLHHHFEALGWPAYKVTMRYWIISVVCAISGIILALIKI